MTTIRTIYYAAGFIDAPDLDALAQNPADLLVIHNGQAAILFALPTPPPRIAREIILVDPQWPKNLHSIRFPAICDHLTVITRPIPERPKDGTPSPRFPGRVYTSYVPMTNRIIDTKTTIPVNHPEVLDTINQLQNALSEANRQQAA